MKDVALVQQRMQLEALVVRAESLYRLVRDGGFRYEFEIQADFARYYCVRVCGFIDFAVNHLLGTYIARHATPKLARFATLALGRQQNLKANRLIEVIATFDVGWRDDLERFLTPQRRDALDSLVDNRNLIAHGRSTGITHVRVKAYYGPVLEVIEFLESKCAA